MSQKVSPSISHSKLQAMWCKKKHWNETHEKGLPYCLWQMCYDWWIQNIFQNITMVNAYTPNILDKLLIGICFFTTAKTKNPFLYLIHCQFTYDFTVGIGNAHGYGKHYFVLSQTLHRSSFCLDAQIRRLQTLRTFILHGKENHAIHRNVVGLGVFIQSHCSSQHQRKPVTVTADNEKQVWHTLYNDHDDMKHENFKFKIGDQVRISKIKRTFEKRYLPNFSKKIFMISKQVPRDPPMYKLKDYDREELKGTFYEKELQKVIRFDVYLTLPSNASMDVLPSNKTGSYHVKLSQTIDLHGDWQVGLYSTS